MRGVNLLNRGFTLSPSAWLACALLLLASGFVVPVLRSASSNSQGVQPYPNAQNVTTRTLSVTDIRREVNSTIFQTNDSVSDILSFYKEEYLARGWRLEDIAAPFITGNDTLYFRSGDSTKQCILIHGVDIVINPLPNGQQEVEIQSWDICGTA